jgi:hypothetical protein
MLAQSKLGDLIQCSFHRGIARPTMEQSPLSLLADSSWSGISPALWKQTSRLLHLSTTGSRAAGFQRPLNTRRRAVVATRVHRLYVPTVRIHDRDTYLADHVCYILQLLDGFDNPIVAAVAASDSNPLTTEKDLCLGTQVCSQYRY